MLRNFKCSCHIDIDVIRLGDLQDIDQKLPCLPFHRILTCYLKQFDEAGLYSILEQQFNVKK